MQGLRILGESVSMQKIPFDTLAFDDLCNPFGSQRNNYSYFQSLISRFGVYIVQEKETGKVLYGGEAHAQDLKERITQTAVNTKLNLELKIPSVVNHSQMLCDKSELYRFWLAILSIKPVTRANDFLFWLACLYMHAARPNPKENFSSS